MQFLKSKEQLIQEKLGSVHEAVFKHGDTFKVKTTIDVPKSLINQFVSKAKKENNIDPRENWSDVDLAEMFVNYIAANFINIESLPVIELLGENISDEVSTEITPEETNIVTVPEQTGAPTPASEIVTNQTNSEITEPTTEIQPQ